MHNLFELNNGLRVIVENIPYVKSVSIGLWIENGSRNESFVNNGISHFIEHMLFKGTFKRSAKEIAEAIEDVGGQLNAFTGKEATCFYIKTLDTYTELALELLSDMIFNSIFSEEDIEREKSVVLEEIGMSEDSPEDVLMDLHSMAIWGNDPISLPILGTIDKVNSFTRDDIKNYISLQYVPENAVISISGNVDINFIQKIAEKYFGQWSGKKENISVYNTPIILNNNYFKEKEIEQLHVSFGIPGFETGNEDIYTLLLLNNAFGAGASSILFQKIREELGLCYSIYSYLCPFKNTGIVNIYAGLNGNNFSEFINVVNDEMSKFVTNGISEEKLYKLKEQLKGNYILGLESTSSRMFNNAKSVLFLNTLHTTDDIMNNIDSITMENLRTVMDKTFGSGIKNSAFVGEIENYKFLENTINGDIKAFKNVKGLKI